jgi:hypothetical protein
VIITKSGKARQKTATLRQSIKKAIDRVAPDRLDSLADYVQFLTKPTLEDQLKQAEQDIDAGKGVDWRKLRDDV